MAVAQISRSTFAGVQVRRAQRVVAPRVQRATVVASAKPQEKVAAAVACAAAAALANPLVAEAAVTPSLRNLLYSVVAGGVVFGAIAFGVTAVASFDPVNRGR